MKTTGRLLTKFCLTGSGSNWKQSNRGVTKPPTSARRRRLARNCGHFVPARRAAWLAPVAALFGPSTPVLTLNMASIPPIPHLYAWGVSEPSGELRQDPLRADFGEGARFFARGFEVAEDFDCFFMRALEVSVGVFALGGFAPGSLHRTRRSACGRITCGRSTSRSSACPRAPTPKEYLMPRPTCSKDSGQYQVFPSGARAGRPMMMREVRRVPSSIM